MEDYIWDGEIDCGWEDLAQKVRDDSSKFAKEMLKIVDASPSDEVRSLISEECMTRFVLLAKYLADQLEDANYYVVEDLQEGVQNPTKLISWILLGSLTEAALQIYLAFYVEDYKNAKWQQWIDFPKEDVKTALGEAINMLVKNEKIESKQGKSLKEAIKEEIKKHTVEHPVQRVMLDEIIQFYESQELLDEYDIGDLREIQSNRNGIHSFEDRSIGDWYSLQLSVRFWCALLNWILDRMPELPDYLIEN